MAVVFAALDDALKHKDDVFVEDYHGGKRGGNVHRHGKEQATVARAFNAQKGLAQLEVSRRTYRQELGQALKDSKQDCTQPIHGLLGLGLVHDGPDLEGESEYNEKGRYNDAARTK